MINFTKKINQRIDKINSLLCVGLDSDVNKIPEEYNKTKFPIFEFNKWIIDQTNQYALAYKPNSAFYESRGETGMKELKLTLEYIQERYSDIAIILDAKRADIDSTNEAYANWAYDWLKVDAITLHPYLGHEALKPFLEREEKGCIILCKTSNPGGGEFQDLEVKIDQEVQDGSNYKKLWQIVAEKVAMEWNKNGNCALVVGATYPNELQKVREIVNQMPILVPGIGAQGGELKTTLSAGKDSNSRGILISVGRSIIYAHDPASVANQLRDEINRYR